ncbi:hypothetical protein ACS0TY_030179 [Phlomoides rotata]
MSVEEKASLVFIPYPRLSHLAAAVTTATLLSDQDDRLAVTVLVMKLPTDTKINPYIKNLPKSRINFVELQENQSILAEMKASKNPRNMLTRFIDSQKDLVKDAVSEIIKTQKLKNISGFVMDMFCTPMIDVANEFGIPSYVFFTCGAASLGFLMHLQSLKDDHDQDLTAYEGSDSAISAPTYVNPVPVGVWPSGIFETESLFLHFFRRFRETKGIIVNTFLEFENHAIKSLNSDEKIPNVYPVGPVLQDERDEGADGNGVIGWLDEQPHSSVVFICFGSRGTLDDEQVKEIAKALEQSEQRFLWSLRKPPIEKMGFPGEFESLDEVLPEGFLDRVTGIGKVIGWAPQLAVLAHPAVGGFVSHCGWNSTLESVWFGVPIATFPLYAEQQLNAFQLVKELDMAEMIRLDYHKDVTGVKKSELVGAEEIEVVIRRLMAEEGRVRQKVKEMQNMARSTLMEGGSSYNARRLLIEDVMRNINS